MKTRHQHLNLTNHKFQYHRGFWSSSIVWKSTNLDRRAFLKLLNSNSETSIKSIIVVDQIYGEELHEALARSDRPDLSNFKMQPTKEIIKTKIGEFRFESSLVGTNDIYKLSSRNSVLVNSILELLSTT